MAKGYQPLISQDGKGVLDGRCAHSLEAVQFTNGGEWLACGQIPGRDSVPQSSRGLLPAQPGVRRIRDQDRDTSVFGERPARTGWVAAPLRPCIQLIQDGAAHLADLEVPERGLTGGPDIALVGFPRRQLPLGNRGVLIQQRRHGHV